MKKSHMIGITFALILSAATFSGMTANAASSGTTVENLSVTSARVTRYHHTSHSGKHARLQVHSCTFIDADGNGVCDNCYWDEDYHAGHHAGDCFGLGASCHITDGHCTSYTDTDGNGFCDNCHNPVYIASATGQNTSSSQADPGQAAAGNTGTTDSSASSQNNTNATDSSASSASSQSDWNNYSGHHGCRNRSGHHGGHH